jgi:hypothetical protein
MLRKVRTDEKSDLQIYNIDKQIGSVFNDGEKDNKIKIG